MNRNRSPLPSHITTNDSAEFHAVTENAASSTSVRQPDIATYPLATYIRQFLSAYLFILILVFGLFFSYSQIMGPLLQSTGDVRPTLETDEQPVPQELQMLFQPSDWERDRDTKLLRTDNMIVLVRELASPESNCMRFSPCTIVWFPNDEKDLLLRTRNAVVMQVEGSVELVFKGLFDMDRGQFGEIQEIRIPGRVQIRRNSDPAQPDDAFYLHASEVSINRERLWTPNDFAIRCGRHSGEGTGLRLHFIPKNGEKGFAIQGVRNAEIQNLKYVTFAPGAFIRPTETQSDAQEFSNTQKSPQETDAARGLQFLEDPDEPISVTCRGAMNFDFQDWKLTLLSYVQILQGPAEAPLGKLTCENLTLQLGPKTDMDNTSLSDSTQTNTSVQTSNMPEANTSETSSSPSLLHGMSQLTLYKIEAIGYPATLFSRGDDLDVAAKSILYNAFSEELIVTNRNSFMGTSTPEDPNDLVQVRQGTNRFETLELRCRIRQNEGLIESSADFGRLTFLPESFASDGNARTNNRVQNGESAAVSPSKNSEFTIVWNGQMSLVPEDSNTRRLTLSGGVEVLGETPDTHKSFQIQADQVLLWLGTSSADAKSKTLNAASRDSFEPLRLRAVCGSNVPKIRVHFPQLTGLFEDVQIWFERDQNFHTAWMMTPATSVDSTACVAPMVRVDSTTSVDSSAWRVARTFESSGEPRLKSVYRLKNPTERFYAQVNTTTVPTDSSFAVPESATVVPVDPFVQTPPMTRLEDLAAPIPMSMPSTSGTTPPSSHGPVSSEMNPPMEKKDVSNGNQLDILENGSEFEAQAKELLASVILSTSSTNMAAPSTRNARQPMGQNVEVRAITLQGNAKIQEITTPTPGMEPYLLEGEQVSINHVQDFEKALFQVVGTPAKLSGRGVHFETAGTLTVDRQTQQANAEGQGVVTMNLAMLQQMQKKSNANPTNATKPEDALLSEPVRIAWQDRMVLQGRTLSLESAAQPVTLDTGDHHLETEKLSIIFRESPLGDTTDTASNRDNLEKIVCGGRVYYRGMNRDDAGNQSSFMELVVSDLVCESSGAFTARQLPASRPGEFRMVQNGKIELENMTSADASTSSSSAENVGKSGVFVIFHDYLQGNWNERYMVLGDQVDAVLGDVKDWSDQLPMNLPPPNGAKLRCNRLSLSMMEIPGSAAQGMDAYSMELEMAGDTEISSRQYTATADKLKYSQSKGVLTLEGTNRAKAKIYIFDAEHSDAPYSSRMIQFWPKTGRLNLEAPSIMDFTP